jgi:hypothetical protein
MTARQVYLNPSCRITRIRRLPAAGRVLVSTGQPVSTNEVIASIDIPEKHLELNVADKLGVSADRVARWLQVKPGDQIQKEAVVAHKGGLLAKSVTSPVDGRVTEITNGKILVEYGSNPVAVKAGFTGTIREIIPDFGAIVVSEGALLQGVWGNGKLAEGLMICMARNRIEELSPERMDVSLRGSVVFGGSCMRVETLKRAAEIPLRGLVVSSIAPDLLEYASTIPFPIMALIGVGKAVYDEHCYQIILKMDKCVACVNATVWDRCLGSRPEVVIPQRGKALLSESNENAEYKIGQLVRILQSPALWETAQIKTLLSEDRLYPSGIVTRSALCILNNGEEIVQPLVNLEVIL